MPRLVVDEPNQRGSRTGSDAPPPRPPPRTPRERPAPQHDPPPAKKKRAFPAVVKCIIAAGGDNDYKMPNKKKGD